MPESASHAPGPRPGEMVLRIPAIQADPVSYLTDCAEIYGDFVRFPVGNKPVYFINHPDAIQRVLQANNRNYTKDTLQYRSLATVTGHGLLTSDGDEWLRQRRLIQPAFSKPNIQEMAGGMIPIIEDTLHQMDQAANARSVVDLDEIMLQLALEIVGKALFSTDLSRGGQGLIQATLTSLDHIVARARMPVQLPDSIPTPANLRFRKALRILDDASHAIIESRRTSPADEIDLLSLLLSARDQQSGQGMDERQVRDELVTLLIAGHETVASALAWTWYLLALNPSVREKFHLEFESTLQDAQPQFEDLASLPYTRQVFDEGLRLYPPAWLITRQSIDSDELCGYEIPPRSLIIISPYTIHRHPSYWDDPETYNPDRFASGSQMADRHKFSYIPFGAGPRLCIGNTFAMVEAQLILASIGQRFQLDLLPGTEKIPAVPLVTLRPKDGLKMTVHRRDRSI